MEKYRIIIDTNLWISLIIGKRLSELNSLCNSDMINVYLCEELISEFMRVANQEKIKKYANNERTMQTVELMKASCIISSINNNVILSSLRDVNDLYLLSLAKTVEANFILTGDNDLLTLQSFEQTKIVTYKEFKTFFEKNTGIQIP